MQMTTFFVLFGFGKMQFKKIIDHLHLCVKAKDDFDDIVNSILRFVDTIR